MVISGAHSILCGALVNQASREPRTRLGLHTRTHTHTHVHSRWPPARARVQAHTESRGQFDTARINVVNIGYVSEGLGGEAEGTRDAPAHLSVSPVRACLLARSLSLRHELELLLRFRPLAPPTCVSTVHYGYARICASETVSTEDYTRAGTEFFFHPIVNNAWFIPIRFQCRLFL